MNAKEIRKNESLEALKRMLKPGDTIYTVLRSVSRSGMSRKIDLYFFDTEGNKHYLSGYAANACEWNRDDQGAIKVGGCGMDMGFHLVYTLGRVMYREGYECAGDKLCCSNDHFNGDRDYTPHIHKDGGYAFKHEWI